MADAEEQEYNARGFILKNSLQGSYWLVKCPCCRNPVEVLQINCRIFNHSTLGPHSSKETCDAYRMAHPDACAKPFYFDGSQIYALVYNDGSPDYTH